MSIIIADDCDICAMPNVDAINSDYIHKKSMQTICVRNKIDYNVTEVRKLTLHFKSHITSVTNTIANQMLQAESAKLKDTVVEASSALDQIDDLSSRIYDMLLRTDDATEFYKLNKNYADLLKRKQEYLQFLYRATGGQTKADLQKAVVMDAIKVARDEMDKNKFEDLTKNNSKDMVDIYMSNPRVRKALKDAGILHDVDVEENANNQEEE